MFTPQSVDHFVATKKMRTSESGASNISSNQDVSISLDDEDTRPMGQKAAKRKEKDKHGHVHARTELEAREHLKTFCNLWRALHGTMALAWLAGSMEDKDLKRSIFDSPSRLARCQWRSASFKPPNSVATVMSSCLPNHRQATQLLVKHLLHEAFSHAASFPPPTLSKQVQRNQVTAGRRRLAEFQTLPYPCQYTNVDAIASEDSLRSHDVSKERKNGVSVDSKQEQVHVHSSAAPPPETEPRQNYPDTLDIAGMDYSPAKKMPPIHN
ncbi:hypothetical protein ZIOFF_050449 [Zingiber officinale]|uniref:Uncharacterized protein n=1 Tax=Zingiber officinale TaxID=94328 RepID=A0A8J5G0K1_ZINOF|nr:hypothetical protein ZIOFF_050449 [Zingiber officinale]